MATHSNLLDWKIPWTEEPGRLQFIGSQRAGHEWSDLACTHTWLEWTWISAEDRSRSYMVDLNKRSLHYTWNDVFLEPVICDLPLDPGAGSVPKNSVGKTSWWQRKKKTKEKKKSKTQLQKRAFSVKWMSRKLLPWLRRFFSKSSDRTIFRFLKNVIPFY